MTRSPGRERQSISTPSVRQKAGSAIRRIPSSPARRAFVDVDAGSASTSRSSRADTTWRTSRPALAARRSWSSRVRRTPPIEQTLPPVKQTDDPTRLPVAGVRSMSPSDPAGASMPAGGADGGTSGTSGLVRFVGDVAGLGRRVGIVDQPDDPVEDHRWILAPVPAQHMHDPPAGRAQDGRVVDDALGEGLCGDPPGMVDEHRDPVGGVAVVVGARGRSGTRTGRRRSTTSSASLRAARRRAARRSPGRPATAPPVAARRVAEAGQHRRRRGRVAARHRGRVLRGSARRVLAPSL